MTYLNISLNGNFVADLAERTVIRLMLDEILPFQVHDRFLPFPCVGYFTTLGINPRENEPMAVSVSPERRSQSGVNETAQVSKLQLVESPKPKVRRFTTQTPPPVNHPPLPSYHQFVQQLRWKRREIYLKAHSYVLRSIFCLPNEAVYFRWEQCRGIGFVTVNTFLSLPCNKFSYQSLCFSNVFTPSSSIVSVEISLIYGNCIIRHYFGGYATKYISIAYVRLVSI